MKDKSVKLNMELCSINKDTEDPTLLKATWILHDFHPNANGVQLSREVSLEASKSIKNKPIVTYYHGVDELGTPTDALGGHEQYDTLDRDGNIIQATETTPIGTITSEAYIMLITNSEGTQEEVMACDSVLWISRFQDACNLLIEWYERGIQIVSSCEYYYKNFTVQDGIVHVSSPVYYDGHCILNSEERGGHKIVQPAYDKSVMLSLNELQEFNKLVSQAIVDESEEKDNMAKKDIKEVNSDEEITTEEVVEAKDTDTTVTKEVSEDENKKEDTSNKTYAELETEIEKLEKKVKELEAKVEELEKASESEKSEKKELSEKFNEATEKVVELNEVIKDLNSYKEKYNKELYEKTLNEKMEFYESKFKALNSVSTFEEAETKALIEQSIEDSEEGTKAIMSLNSMILDLVTVDDTKEVQENKIIKENCSASKTLLNVETSFDSKYK